jgi:hypothetical protein
MFIAPNYFIAFRFWALWTIEHEQAVNREVEEVEAAGEEAG